MRFKENLLMNTSENSERLFCSTFIRDSGECEWPFFPE
jgi:hypothetical protein